MDSATQNPSQHKQQVCEEGDVITRPESHIRYKVGAWLRGFISNPMMRPPMPKPGKEEIQRLYELLSNAGLSVIERTGVKRITKSLEL